MSARRDDVPQPDPLDNPVYAALTGPHARFAERRGAVLRYPADVCPFVGLPAEPSDADWADAAELAGPGGLVPLAGVGGAPPDTWRTALHGSGRQLVGEQVVPAVFDEAVRLTTADVPDMLALVARTGPGPFRPRTIELGRYLGVRRGGRLVAMAGERLHPPGLTEISAVCTDAAFRGQGLAGALVLAVAAGIRARGETPFLHVADGNTTALRLYGSLGFRLRRTVTFTAVRVPD